MTRDEMLAEVARLHYEHSIKYADRVPYVKADENPHDGQTTDLSLWHVDRSAPAEIDDELNREIMRLISQVGK